MQCQQCEGNQFTKAGHDRVGRQLSCCSACGRRQTPRSASAFRGYRFPDDVIALAVRWYLRFRLPYADIKDAARPHRHRVGTCWAVDETYIRLAGHWVYA